MADDFIAHYYMHRKNLEKYMDGLKDPGADFFSRFLEDPLREYHDYKHIVNLRQLHADLLNQTGMTSKEAVLVDLAIWWHDIIYDPRRKDNEWTSAELFAHFYCGRYPTNTDLVMVHTTIIDTQHFNGPILKRPWSLYMLDLDLAGLGSDWNTYLINKNNIKREYMNAGGLKESAFYKGRKAFLEAMLNRGRPVFHNPYGLEFYHKREIQAVLNMKRELDWTEQELLNFNH